MIKQLTFGESNFGRAKKELAMYNANMRAEILQDKLLLRQFSTQQIESFFDKYWEKYNLTEMARKRLDKAPKKKDLQKKRWEEKEAKFKMPWLQKNEIN